MADGDQQYLFTLQNGTYKILKKVGDGGMGIVYRGIDNLMRAVAIKEFAPAQQEKLEASLLAELKDAFQREARLLAHLEHPSLPKVFGYFTEGTNLYLVMEYIEGDNLKTQMEELKKFEGQFPVKKVKGWSKEILRVLVYLHERDLPIFHRDIKPDNLKVRDGRICLLDFGLAKGTAGEMSAEATRTIFGFTVRYAPIEQIRGDKTTAQTDLYALAATLYYLLTSEEPSDSRLRDKQRREFGTDPLKAIRELRPEVDETFSEVVMEALRVEAKDRPVSARAMLQRLEDGLLPAPERNYPSEAVDPELTTLAKPRALPPTPLPPSPAASPASARQSPLFKKLFLFAIVGVALLCLSGAGLIFILGFGSSSPPPITNSQTPTTTSNQSSSDNKKLIAKRDLYERPFSQAKVIDTLPSGTSFQIIEPREEASDGNHFYWSRIKVFNSRKEGWVRLKCAENPEAAPKCD
jgi:serine/threonine protein kinase